MDNNLKYLTKNQSKWTKVDMFYFVKLQLPNKQLEMSYGGLHGVHYLTLWLPFPWLLAQRYLYVYWQEGYVKSLKLAATSSDNDKIQVILQSDYQVTKISQSLTGNLLTASISNKNQQETYIY